MGAGKSSVLIPIGDSVDGVDNANVVHDVSFQFMIKRGGIQLLGVRLGRAFRLRWFRWTIRCHHEVRAGSDQGRRGLLECLNVAEQIAAILLRTSLNQTFYLRVENRKAGLLADLLRNTGSNTREVRGLSAGCATSNFSMTARGVQSALN